MESKGKIKIAYLTRDLILNGISTVILNYCKNINKDKFEITVIAGKPINEIYYKELKKIGVKLIEIPNKDKNTFKYYMSLLKELNKKKYDIVHIHGNSAMITIELLIAKIKGIKIRLVHSHNNVCDHPKIHKILKPFFDRLCIYGFACSDMAGKWLFDKTEYMVIQNGFNTKDFIFNDNNRNRIRKELKIKDDAFVIGHVGRFNKQKNHTFLLEIFEDISKKKQNAFLLLVGTGPDYKDIKRMISKHPNKNRIICYGESNNVSELYDAMDTFVLPSKYEGLGIVLIEAEAKGLPCVSSDVIPAEAKLSNKIITLSLSDDIEKWTETILNNKIKDRAKFYTDNIEKIEQFDIKKNAVILENKYIELYNR